MYASVRPNTTMIYAYRKLKPHMKISDCTLISFPSKVTDVHTKTTRPTTNMTPLMFNNANGACQMKSCKFRGFEGPLAVLVPNNSRIF